MALDPTLIGFSYPATPPYLVGREKIREFAAAIGADDAIYFDPAAARSLGYPDVIAPPTFPIAVTEGLIQTLIEDPKLGLDFDRVVHGDQRYTYHRPVHAGDKLTCVLTIADISERAGAGFLSTSTEITTVEGEPVATAISRLVVRAPAPESEN
jgi:acyl dehydratase